MINACPGTSPTASCAHWGSNPDALLQNNVERSQPKTCKMKPWRAHKSIKNIDQGPETRSDKNERAPQTAPIRPSKTVVSNRRGYNKTQNPKCSKNHHSCSKILPSVCQKSINNVPGRGHHKAPLKTIPKSIQIYLPRLPK